MAEDLLILGQAADAPADKHELAPIFAAQGVANAAIAARLDVDVEVVSRWRKRFVAEGLAGLGDRKRSGRPRSFPAQVVTEVKAMACEPPQARSVPLSRWSSADLVAQVVVEGLAVSVSASTRTPWTAPVGSTSTTPPPGRRTQHRRTNERDH